MLRKWVSDMVSDLRIGVLGARVRQTADMKILVGDIEGLRIEVRRLTGMESRLDDLTARMFKYEEEGRKVVMALEEGTPVKA